MQIADLPAGSSELQLGAYPTFVIIPHARGRVKPSIDELEVRPVYPVIKWVKILIPVNTSTKTDAKAISNSQNVT